MGDSLLKIEKVFQMEVQCLQDHHLPDQVPLELLFWKALKCRDPTKKQD